MAGAAATVLVIRVGFLRQLDRVPLPHEGVHTPREQLAAIDRVGEAGYHRFLELEARTFLEVVGSIDAHGAVVVNGVAALDDDLAQLVVKVGATGAGQAFAIRREGNAMYRRVELGYAVKALAGHAVPDADAL